MRFLLDVCAASRTLFRSLSDAGHDELSAADGYAHYPDEDLLSLALAQRRVLVTKDKDFGKLVFVRRLPHPCIIRLAVMSPIEQSVALRELIRNDVGSIQEGAMIVVTGGRVRIRSTRNAGRGEI